MDNYDYDRPMIEGPPPGNALAIASIVIGIGAIVLVVVKFFLFFLAIFFIALSVGGLLMAVAARKQNERAGQRSALPMIGIIVNCISIFIHSTFFVACTVCTACVCTFI